MIRPCLFRLFEQLRIMPPSEGPFVLMWACSFPHTFPTLSIPRCLWVYEINNDNFKRSGCWRWCIQVSRRSSPSYRALTSKNVHGSSRLHQQNQGMFITNAIFKIFKMRTNGLRRVSGPAPKPPRNALITSELGAARNLLTSSYTGIW